MSPKRSPAAGTDGLRRLCSTLMTGRSSGREEEEEDGRGKEEDGSGRGKEEEGGRGREGDGSG